MSSCTWLGPQSKDGLIEIGPVRIDRWRRQPLRTLLFGVPKNKGDEQQRIGPGLVAAVALSKGHPDNRVEGDAVCAGVRLVQAEGERPAKWYCPCDVRITLVGETSADLTRTVSWVMTPENSEIFFNMLPLADVEQNFVTDTGALCVKAQLFFHLCMQPRGGHPAILPLGAHGATLRALMYSWCLADLSKSKERRAGKSNAGDAESVGEVGFLDVCRSGIMQWVPPQTTPLSVLGMLPAPGLLPPCPDLPSAFAQEVIPGLMIASGEAMSKLVELHDVGVGTLLEVSLRRPWSFGVNRQPRDVSAPKFDVRQLQLRGCGDTVELVENPVCVPEARTALDTIILIERALEGVLSGSEGKTYMLVLPREEDQDMEACAALVAVTAARCFHLTFAESQRYVRTRWDVAITEAWAQHFAAEGDLLPAEAGATVVNSACTEQMPDLATRCLMSEVAEALMQGSSDGSVLEKAASWFEAASGAAVSLGNALVWEETWHPCPGLCIRVYDSGWGSASEVFRAVLASGENLKVSAVIIRTMTRLPKGEIFEIPHHIDSDDDTWYLHALVLVDSLISFRPHCVSFFHGASLWMIDADSKVHELSRQHFSGSRIENWLCTSDMLAKAAVYVRNKRPKSRIPVPPDNRPCSKPARSATSTEHELPSGPSGSLIFRIITEKMLQQSEGDFSGGSNIIASTVLTLPTDVGIEDLQGRVHETMKIPPSRQLLLHLPDSFEDHGVQHLFPLREPLSAMVGVTRSLTLLLLFVSSPLDSAPLSNDSSSSAKMPVLCKYFDKHTLRFCVLGVLFASPTEHLLQHVDWISKRRMVVMGVPADPKQKDKSEPLFACSMEVGTHEITPIRMDWPLHDQQILFGSVLIFEASACGRQVPLPESKSLEEGGGNTNFAAALSQLVVPPPPITLLGCTFFDGDIRAQRAKGRCNGESDAWGAFQRALCEAADAELGLELVSVSMHAEHGSAIVFKILLDGNMVVASEIAKNVCSCFATPDSGGQRRSLCRGRLARHLPRELFITAGTARGGSRVLWHAMAPNSTEFIASGGRNSNAMPSPLLSVLFSLGVPIGEVEVFEVGSDMNDGTDLRAAGQADCHAVSLLLEEGHLDAHNGQTLSTRKRRRALERQSADAASVKDSSKGTGSDASVGGGICSPEEPDDSPSGEVNDDTVQSTEADDSGTSSPLRIFANQTGPRLRSDSEGAVLPGWSECRNFLTTGICYDGARCKSAHPTGSQLARSESCPFRSESRDSCPLRICCAFAHGEAERLCPPYIRARAPAPSSCEHSVASTPVTSAPLQQGSAIGGAGVGVGSEENTASVVKKMLFSTTDQLFALLAEAKALNMTEELHSVEKLFSFFLLKGAGLPRRDAGAPRSSAMSRSSSCDSFLDEVPNRDAARLVLASTLTPGEATQPSTPRSLVHTPGARQPNEFRTWPDTDAPETVTETLGEGSILPPPTATLNAPNLPSPALNNTMPLAPALPAGTIPVASSMAASTAALPVLGTAAHVSAPILPIVSWREPMLEPSNSPGLVAAWADECPVADPQRVWALEPSGNVIGTHPLNTRDEGERQRSKPTRLERRPSLISVSTHDSVRWHSSPWCISRTPNIRTPVSHCSPARSPTSFSGYCSPITGLPSGVASPNQRRSRSGYSSPSTDRTHGGPTFFAGTATQSGLMRRLMSLREAREEKEDDGEFSSDERAEKAEAEGKNLLDYLQEQSQSASLNRIVQGPANLCLDLRADFLSYCRRGLAPSRTLLCLNSFFQSLLPCAPLMHLFAQLSWHTLTHQRPTYVCFVQIAFQFFGAMRSAHSGPNTSSRGMDDGGSGTSVAGILGDVSQGSQAAMLAPIDIGVYTEPLLRRFERAKAPASAPPGSCPTETLCRFVHFVLSELHNECKWPVLSPNAIQYEDSPINRIFGGLLRNGLQVSDGHSPQRMSGMNDFSGLMDTGNVSVEPFLVLHLELTAEPCASVMDAIQQVLRPENAHFARLPPFLLVHLRRFRSINGVPTRVSRHCHIDMRLELEEATSHTLRAVGYELCSAVCHYGETPECGTYKALARHVGSNRRSPERRGSAPPGLSSPHTGGASLPSSVTFGNPGLNAPSVFNSGSNAVDWYVFDDTAVRMKPAEEHGAVVQCEGYHVCFLMYRREDTKTINIRPHVV